MLQLVDLSKHYRVVNQYGKVISNQTIKALDGVNLSFGDTGLVSIIGTSGSGKSTLMSVLAGLTKPEKGSDIIVDGISTSSYSENQWNTHRNTTVGMIFQQYHLIEQLTVLDNVKLSLDLAGISGKAKVKQAKDLLIRLGLAQHIYKKPNTLSGGQKQRVAIARAIINKPRILLCDEPTGALDSTTGRDIMQLLRDISRDTLVLMVTHDMALAHGYSDRIVELSDGMVVADNVNTPESETDVYTDSSDVVSPAKVSKRNKHRNPTLGAFTASKIAFRNMITKLSRTILTAIACAIGITGVGLSLALNYGFSQYSVDIVQQQLATYPIMVDYYTSTGAISRMEEVYAINIDTVSTDAVWNNYLSSDYMQYLYDMDDSWTLGMSCYYSVEMPLITDGMDNQTYSYTDESTYGMFILSSEQSVNDEQLTLLAGSYPTQVNEIVLIVDNYNTLSTTVMNALFPDLVEGTELTYDEILGQQLVLPQHDDIYLEISDPTSEKLYYTNTDAEMLFCDDDGMVLEIVGILRRENASIIGSSRSMGCMQELYDYYFSQAATSGIVEAQLANSEYNVLTGSAMSTELYNRNMYEYEYTLRWLGADDTPTACYIYAADDISKGLIIDYLAEYNVDKDEYYQVYPVDYTVYCGTMETILSLGVVVFLGLSGLCVIVSAVLIAIIAYTSVLEQKKKIGLLRSIGASKLDIIRVFSGENVMIGLLCGIIGSVCATLLCPFANDILLTKFGIANIAVMTPAVALIVVGISLAVNVIAGLIPAVMASNQDPIDCLNTAD